MRVLIVDDEAIIRLGVSKLLINSINTIIHIIEAKNGKIALEQIEQEKPDLIISDIRMPVMDGLKLAEEVYRFYPEIKIVILTGYADFTYAQRALQFGVVDFLLKPVTQENLNDTILKILLNNPAKWTEHLDSNMIRVMKETITELVKCVLAENKAGVERALSKWQEHCVQHGFSLFEMKQLMGHFYIAYKSEYLLHLRDFSMEVQKQIHSSVSSNSELFEHWHSYLLEQMMRISEKRAPRNKRVVDYVIQEIHTSYSDIDLKIQKLASKTGVTSAYLSKIFREVMHKPITQYISEYRLERARTRLEWDETTKISLIAEECGFNDYPYFSKIFKKLFGISPLEYRDTYISS